MKKSIFVVMGVMLLFAFTFVACKKENMVNPSNNSTSQNASMFEKTLVGGVKVHSGKWDGVPATDLCCDPVQTICWIEVTAGSAAALIHPAGVYANKLPNDLAYFVSGAEYVSEYTGKSSETYYVLSKSFASPSVLTTPFSTIAQDLGL